MNCEFLNVKGSFDYLGGKQIIRENVKTTLCETFRKYGFSPVETPIINYYDLLSSKYSQGADILKETYKLTDQGSRELGLRYDLTITFAKLISMQKELKMPFKRYEIGKVFRDGPVKLGRNREFTQCDVDVVGIKSLMPEADFFAMSKEFYQKIGLDVEISFNNRKLLSGLIKHAGVKPELVDSSIMLIDKLLKMSHRELEGEFEKIGVDSATVSKLFEVFSLSYDQIKQSFANSDITEINDGLSELAELYSYIDALELNDIMVFSPNLARGIGIYTGTVWEIFVKDRSITSSIGAGGRYDNIITSFIDNGKQYPAVGMTFGLDVIYEAIMLKEKSLIQTPTMLYIIPMGTQANCLKLSRELRSLGVNVDIEMNGVKLKKSLDYANKLAIPFVIIIGENELQSGAVKLKNMESGEQTELSLDDIPKIAGLILG